MQVAPLGHMPTRYDVIRQPLTFKYYDRRGLPSYRPCCEQPRNAAADNDHLSHSTPPSPHHQAKRSVSVHPLTGPTPRVNRQVKGLSMNTADDRVLPYPKVLSLCIVPFLLAGFVILYLFPLHTARLWAWPLRPTMTAMVL